MPPIAIQPTGKDGRIRDAKRRARQITSNYTAALDDLTTNWSGLTQAAKVEAVRAALVLVMRVVKFIIEKERLDG
jgi:hypothetical protein